MLDKNKSQHSRMRMRAPRTATCGKRNRFFRGKRMKADDFADRAGLRHRAPPHRQSLRHRRGRRQRLCDDEGTVGRRARLRARHARTRDRAVARGDARSGQPVPHRGRRERLPDAAARSGRARQGITCCRFTTPSAATARPTCRAAAAASKPEQNYVCETAVFSLDRSRRSLPVRREAVPPDVRVRRSPTRAASAADTDNRAAGEGSEPGRCRRGRAGADELPPPEQRPTASVTPHANRGRGPHACLCHWLMDEPVDCSRPTLVRVERLRDRSVRRRARWRASRSRRPATSAIRSTIDGHRSVRSARFRQEQRSALRLHPRLRSDTHLVGQLALLAPPSRADAVEGLRRGLRQVRRRRRRAAGADGVRGALLGAGARPTRSASTRSRCAP